MITDIIVQLNFIVFVFIVIALFFALKFLWIHRDENGKIQQLRKVIWIIILAKALYFTGEIMSIILLFTVSKTLNLPIALTIFIPSVVLLCVDIWAYAKIKEIQHT